MEDSLRHLIEQQSLQQIQRVEQSLSAVSMTPDQANELNVASSTPGFRAVRRYFDRKGHVLLVAVTLHPGHLFNYFARYERSESA
jgi:DNA-binding GntR family transcriptional regulator